MQSHQWKWGVNQWVEYLRDKEFPVRQATRAALAEMQALSPEEKERLCALDIREVVYGDPYLALKILRRAEERRSRQLGRDTTTPLAAVLQTGYDEIIHIVSASTDLGEHAPGCRKCEARSVLAGSIGRAWAEHRADISPDEVAMAALLADIGELLLWHYAPEMTDKETQIRDWNETFWALNHRPSEMEFTFRQLTVALAQAWELPNLVVMLIRGVDTLRANLSRLASETAKLIMGDASPEDLVPVLKNVLPLLPGASAESVVAPLGLSEEIQAQIVALMLAEPAEP